MRSSDHYIGIDLGGSHIRSVVARDDGPIPRIIGRDERATPRSGPDDVVAAKGSRNFIYVTISTGIGGAFVIDGHLLRGAANTAGEIGHIPVALEGPRCGCGSYGCVESLAAGRFIAEAYGVDDAARVYAAAASGDSRAVAILARAEAALGNLAITLVNGLNPSLIVIGGSIAEHEPAHTLEPMRRAIDTRAFRVAADGVRRVPLGLRRAAGMLGAVISARERLAGRGEWFL